MSRAKEILAGAYGVEFMVISSKAAMPGNCWGGSRYMRVAVVCVLRGAYPRYISERSTSVLFIAQTWERLYGGSTARCAYRQALAAAEAMAAEANASLVRA